MNQKQFTLFLFAVLFAVFSFLGFILYTGIEETGEKKEWEVHSIVVKEKINELRRLNYNLETLNRGYLLTKDSVYVKDNQVITAEILHAIDTLDFLVSDNISQIQRMSAVKTVFRNKFVFVDSLRAVITFDRKTEIFDSLLMSSNNTSYEIEEIAKLMLIEEDALLRLREDAFDQELYSSKSSLLGLAIGLLLILVAVTVFLFRIFNQINVAKKLLEERNLILEKTKRELELSNESLRVLSSQFESSLQRSKVAAFEWPDTHKDDFWLSDSMYQMLGITKNDFKSNMVDFFTQLMHPEDAERVQSNLEKHLINGATYNPEYRLKKKDGSYRYFRALGSSIIENKVQSMTGVIIDINEEVELRKTRDAMTSTLEEYALRFDLVLKSSSYGVWDWYDINQPFQWWSETYYDLIGYSKDEMDSSIESFQKLLHPEDVSFTQNVIQNNIEFGTKINIEYRLNTKKHGYKWFRAVGNRIIDEKEPDRVRVIGVVSDISKEKMFFEELKRSNADLQDFAYVASHDLQEPLRKIQAFGDRLKTYVEKNFPDFEGLEYVDKMNYSATRMRRLIDDLLNFSRVSSESNFTEMVDLNEVLCDVKDLLSESIKSNDALVEIHQLPTIHEANKGNLTQLFQNLISNALKFKKENTKPIIEIVSSEIDVSEAIEISPLLNRYEKYYRIEIKDNGIGFDEGYLSKIFTIFQRLHGRAEYEGTGIGLAVCQKICENHEGTITAQSREGEGATFIVILPMIKTQK